jgi:hypothetical protein
MSVLPAITLKKSSGIPGENQRGERSVMKSPVAALANIGWRQEFRLERRRFVVNFPGTK